MELIREETIDIPNEKGPLIIGKGGSNVKRITEESGARVKVEANRLRHKAKITGTDSQRANAKKLINKLIYESKSRQTIPTIGFTLLGSDDTFNLREAMFRFVKFTGEDSNVHSQKKEKYYVEKIDKTNEEDKGDEIDDLANQLRHGLNLPLSKGGYITWDKFDECLNVIFEQLSKADPTNSVGKEIRLNIFFGRELFTGVFKKTFDSHDWCSFSREIGHSKISTSFQHILPQIADNIHLIQEKFELKLQKETLAGDKRSISVYHNRNYKKMKLKLHWFEKEETWKITRVAKDINREGKLIHRIVDLVSGTSMPDMRFLLKSQYDIRIDNKDKEMIADIQSKPLVEREGLWFRISDFNGKLDCTGIRQTVKKKVYANEKFQVTLQTTLQEFPVNQGHEKKVATETKVTTEETISVKNLSWRAVENIDKSTALHFDEEELGSTIRDTIEFAREIAKTVM
ncbi:8980_t:CDS:2 [Acaulospora morrowiae]|uniref:8980_t:CDS:1 n=1 Tax=Acaulospora morrowiae TaxID=94023 RepID=A0A9N9C3D4_9GLOM|nr:8980_t:CDS:2 [Acaulospora morrowiae]